MRVRDIKVSFRGRFFIGRVFLSVAPTLGHRGPEGPKECSPGRKKL